MTEGEQDRDTMATGTTVVSSDVHDADIARARGEDDKPKRPAEERDAPQSQPGRREEPAHADRRRHAPLLPPMSRCKRVRPAPRTGCGNRTRKHPLALAAAVVRCSSCLLAAAVAGTGLAVWASAEGATRHGKAEHDGRSTSKTRPRRPRQEFENASSIRRRRRGRPR